MISSTLSPRYLLSRVVAAVVVFACLSLAPVVSAGKWYGTTGGENDCGNFASSVLCTYDQANPDNCPGAPLNCSSVHAIDTDRGVWNPGPSGYSFGSWAKCRYTDAHGDYRTGVVTKLCVQNASFSCGLTGRDFSVLCGAPKQSVLSGQTCARRSGPCLGDEVITELVIGATGGFAAICCMTYLPQCSTVDYMEKSALACTTNFQGVVNAPQMAATGICSQGCDPTEVFGTPANPPYMYYCTATIFTYSTLSYGSCKSSDWSVCPGDTLLVGVTASGCTAPATRAVCRSPRFSTWSEGKCKYVTVDSGMAWCPKGYVARQVCAPRTAGSCVNGSSTALYCCNLRTRFQGGMPCPMGYVYSVIGGFRNLQAPVGLDQMVGSAVALRTTKKFGDYSAMHDLKFDDVNDDLYFTARNLEPQFVVQNDLWYFKGYGLVGRIPMSEGGSPVVEHLAGSLTLVGARTWSTSNGTGFWTNLKEPLKWTENGMSTIGVSTHLNRLFITQDTFLTVGNLGGGSAFWQYLIAGSTSDSPPRFDSPTTCDEPLNCPLRCNASGLPSSISAVLYYPPKAELFISSRASFIARQEALELSYYVGTGTPAAAQYASGGLFRTSTDVGLINQMLIWEDKTMYYTDERSELTPTEGGIVALDLSTGILEVLTLTWPAGVLPLRRSHGITMYRNPDMTQPLVLFATDARDGIIRINMENLTATVFAGTEKSDANARYVDRKPLFEARFYTPQKLANSRTHLFIADLDNTAARAIVLSPCGPGFNASARCLGCDEHYFKYPNCRQNCSVRYDCYSRATSVSGIQSASVYACTCVCFWQYRSNNCTTCQPGFDIRFNCRRCDASTGFIGSWPACRLPTATVSRTPRTQTITSTVSISASIHRVSPTSTISMTDSRMPPTTLTMSWTRTPTRSKTTSVVPPRTPSHEATRTATSTKVSTLTRIPPPTFTAPYTRTQPLTDTISKTKSITITPAPTPTATFSHSTTRTPSHSVSQTTYTIEQSPPIITTPTVSRTPGTPTQSWSRTLPSQTKIQKPVISYTQQPTLTRVVVSTPVPTVVPVTSSPSNVSTGTPTPATTSNLTNTTEPAPSATTLVPDTAEPSTVDPHLGTAPPPLTGAPPGETMPPIEAAIDGDVYVDALMDDGPINRRSLNITLDANAEFDPKRCRILGVVKYGYTRSARYDLSFLNDGQVFCDRWHMIIIFPTVPRADAGQRVTVNLLLHDALTLNRTLSLKFHVIPITIGKAAESAQEAAGTAAVGVSAIGGTTANEMQGMALMGMISCADPKLKGSMHSARSVMSPWKVGDDELGYITGNVLLVIIFSAAATLGQGVLYLKFKRDKDNGVHPEPEEFPDPTADPDHLEPWPRAASLVQWPGRYINFIALTHQGICFEAHLRLHDPERSPLGLFVGIVGVLYGIAVPCACVWWMKKKFRAKYCEYKYLPQTVPFVVRLFAPKAFWMPLEYTKHYGALFEDVGPPNVWFSIYDPLIKVNIVSAIAAFQLSPGPACKAQYGLLTAVYAIEAIARIVRWPARTLVSNLSPLAAAITTALLASSAGFEFSLLSTEIAMLTQSYLSIVCGVLAVMIKTIDRRMFQPREIKARYENADFEFEDPNAKKDGEGDEEEDGAGKGKKGKKKDKHDDPEEIEMGAPLLGIPISKKGRDHRRGKGKYQPPSSGSDTNEGDSDQGGSDDNAISSPLLKLSEKKRQSKGNSTLDMLLAFKEDVKAADQKEARRSRSSRGGADDRKSSDKRKSAKERKSDKEKEKGKGKKKRRALDSDSDGL